MIGFSGRRAAFGTLHGKERVLRPVLERELGLIIELPKVNTDMFGTFSGEMQRVGHASDAAVAKAQASIAAVPGAAIGLASEGSFGPHPQIPFVAAGAELVLLLDQERGLSLWGRDLTTETNYGGAHVQNIAEVRTFAKQAKFPEHALVLMGVHDGRPDHRQALHKGIQSYARLEELSARHLAAHGEAWLETDMRAHLNPTRMRSIERAVEDLVRVAKSLCPQCSRPGFVVVDVERGLPCADCGAPTRRPMADIWACEGCQHRDVRPRDGAASVSAFECDLCNP